MAPNIDNRGFDFPSNPVLALVPGERRYTLFAQPDSQRNGDWVFDVHLCGEDETVFFDV